ncbi:MAG: VOC family protein [Candidatus Heimdallarchaeota archaeon]
MIKVSTNLHHAHLFASSIDKSLNFYSEMFGAETLFDLEMAGARNVMISIGTSRINFYDQSPRDTGRGAIHHLGIETDNLEKLIEHMKEKGYEFKNKIKIYGLWKYVMVEGPDNVLLELFEIVRDRIPQEQLKKISSLY